MLSNMPPPATETQRSILLRAGGKAIEVLDHKEDGVPVASVVAVFREVIEITEELADPDVAGLLRILAESGIRLAEAGGDADANAMDITEAVTAQVQGLLS